MNDACCAHSRVMLRHHDYPDGTRADYWECSSGCGAKFVLESTDQAGRRLRDWFAGMALQALTASVTQNQQFATYIGKLQKAQKDETPELTVAKAAYDHADAMLKQRAYPAPPKSHV